MNVQFGWCSVPGAVARFVQILRDLAPKDTGNLAYNAIQYEQVSEREHRIYIDLEIAPYQIHVNENDTLGNGKPNPNKGWWEAAIELAIEEMARLLEGEIL